MTIFFRILFIMLIQVSFVYALDLLDPSEINQLSDDSAERALDQYETDASDNTSTEEMDTSDSSDEDTSADDESSDDDQTSDADDTDTDDSSDDESE